MGKKLYIKTWGCQMNVYDSERMRDVLSPLGYAETATPEEADLVILNTCHIREKAAEKVYSELGKIRQMKRARAGQGAEMLIAVAGCVAQAEGEEIVRRAPAVDLVFGPQTYHRLPQLLARRQEGGRAVVETEFPAEDKFEGLDAKALPNKGVAAFLTVQEGCDCVTHLMSREGNEIGGGVSRVVLRRVFSAQKVAKARHYLLPFFAG